MMTIQETSIEDQIISLTNLDLRWQLSPSLGHFVFTTAGFGRTVYMTCSLIWNANSARKLEAWGVMRGPQIGPTSMCRIWGNMINPWTMEFLRFGRKIHLFFSLWVICLDGRLFNGWRTSANFTAGREEGTGECRKIATRHSSEGRDQGGERFETEGNAHMDIDNKHRIVQLDLILGQSFHSILYIAWGFVAFCITYMKVCHTSFMIVLSEHAIPRYLLLTKNKYIYI